MTNKVYSECIFQVQLEGKRQHGEAVHMLKFVYSSSYQASEAAAIYSVMCSVSIPMVSIDNDECMHGCIPIPIRIEHDIISGAAMPFQLSTCAWHSTTCISEVHRSSTPPVTTPSLYSLCNECLAQSVKQPFWVIKLWDVPGVRLRVVSNNKSSNRSKNDESRDVRQLPVLGNNSLKEESQNKRNEKQLLDWNEIERGRPWFTPNRNAGLDVASIIPDAKGQAPRRHPPDEKRKAVTPPIVVGGIHTFLNRYVSVTLQDLNL